MDVRRTSLTAHETRTRILDAAQALFVAHGFEATSMRMITGDAGVNLAAVNYHFGSKDVLVREVLKRHLQPLNAQRMQALDAAEAAAGNQPVKPHRIVDAFFSSSLDLASGSAAGREFMQLLGRTFTEPSPTVREYLAEEYAPVIGRFRDAFCRALPTVPVEDILWRLHFMLGAIALEAGTVWWEGELFAGEPDWKKLQAYPWPKLTPRSSPSSTTRPTSCAA
jgi:AcrR family transcriptional regulator